MKHFLLVEDSPIIVKIIRHICKGDPSLHCDVAASFSEARTLVEQKGSDYYLVAVVDLHLPDAPHGEVVDYTIEQGIPTIVMTGNFDESIREQMQQKKIVDYVVKESRFSYEYVIKQIKRLDKNKDLKILVVDDSAMSRKFICNLLKMQLFQVVEADDGDTALAMINEDNDIRLVITDYNMPRMNGFELVKNVRKEVDKNDLVIVGLSGEGDSKLSAKFIKNGANDFLSKPFGQEEFNCRILHNIENMEYLQTMRHMAYHDYATGLPNKRQFFEQGAHHLQEAQKHSTAISLALIAVDHPHQLQDQYGLDATETVMQNLAELMPKAFGRFKYARVSDSEIAVLLVGLNQEKALKLIEGFRAVVEDHIVLIDELSFNFSVSAGLSSQENAPLNELIKLADNHLHIAKQEGGNQVVNEA